MMPALLGGPAPLRMGEILSQNPARTVILSNEGLSNHFYDFDSKKLEQFRAETDGFETVLIFVTRGAEGWLPSFHKQCVLNPRNGASDLWGTSLTLDEIRTHPRVRALLDQDRILAEMMRGYGATVAWRLEFDDPGWFEALLERLGLNGAAFPPLPKTNVSIPDWAIEVMRQINWLCPDDEGVRIAWMRAFRDYLRTDNFMLVHMAARAGASAIEPGILDAIAMPPTMPEIEVSAFDAFASLCRARLADAPG